MAHRIVGLLLIFALATTDFTQAARLDLESSSLTAPQANRTHNGPKEGGCAQHDIDNYSPQADGVCHVRFYKCSDFHWAFPIRNSNLGDVAWGLSKKCAKYGQYLHIWKVKVAHESMVNGDHKYKQCNRHPDYGILCGCGLHPEKASDLNKHCPGQEPWKWGPTTPGWRTKRYDLGQVYQFSLPYRAEGEVDNEKAKQYFQHKGYKKNKPTDDDANFQWQEVHHERTIDINNCLKKHVLNHGGSAEETIERFRAAVLEGTSEGCEDVSAKGDSQNANDES
jgi:hypothetical protein